MDWLASGFSIATAAAGWYYLVIASPDAGLEGLETAAANRWRRRLRRAGGATMLLLAGSFYAAYRLTPADQNPDPALHPAAPWAWVLVVALLGVVLALALVDVILTGRIRRSLSLTHQTQPPRSP